MADYVTPSDRDYMIRTIMGEAANQPDEGVAAVGHVIMNRVKKGYGKTPTEVVFAPNQFEPWSTRKKELLGYSGEEPEYKRVGSIVDGIISNKIKDPTNGATHFLQEDIVRKRRGGGLPDWAQGQGVKIGDHTFHYPDEPDRPESRPRVASVLDKYTKGAAPVASDAQPVPLAEGLSLIDKYTKKPTVNISTKDPLLPKPGEPVTGAEPQWQRDLKTVGGEAISAVPNFFKSMASNVQGGINQVGEGLNDLSKGEIFPSGFGKPPAERKGGGLLKIAGGVMQGVGGATMITPATETLENTVTNVTGNETAGKAAGLVGNMLSSGVVAKQANRMRPTTRANEMIGGAPMTPEQIARLDANPRLRPMDVNPSLQGKALGLSVEEGEAKNLLYSRAREHADSAPEAVREAYTATTGPAVNPIEKLRALQKTTRDNADKGFGDTFRNAKPVNSTPVIQAIDDVLKPGVTAVASPGTTVAWGPLQHRLAELRQDLTDGVSVVSDPKRLHEIQYTLGREINELSQSTVGAEKKMARDLRKVQDALVEQIDQASGGKYRPAREKFKTDKEVEEAYEKGFDVVRNRTGLKGALEDSPDAWREWINGRPNKKGQIVGAATTEELEAARVGARAAIEQRIQGFRHSARRGTDIMDVPYNVEKLEALFGKTEAERLARLLRDEKDIAYSNNKLLNNSVTAEKTLNAASVKPRELDAPMKAEKLLLPAVGTAAEMWATGGMPSGFGAGVGVAAMAAKHVANRLGRRSDLARNEIMADILSTGGSQGMTGARRAAESGNRLLGRPTVPFTYVPEDYRAKRVPLAKD